MGADPLAAASRFPSRVVNELHVLIGGALDALIEHPGRLLQHLGKGRQQGEGDVAQPLLPRQQLCLHLGQGRGPLVGACEPLPGVAYLRQGEGLFLVHDVELLSPVRPLPGEFGPHQVVATKVRGVHHLHRQLLLQGQGEEACRQRQGIPLLRFAQTMACQIEEADVAGRPAKLGQHLATLLGGAIDRGIVDDGQ